jgi:hypothetical protein
MTDMWPPDRNRKAAEPNGAVPPPSTRGLEQNRKRPDDWRMLMKGGDVGMACGWLRESSCVRIKQ